jgi:iron(III) transport system substrate-binding protein
MGYTTPSWSRAPGFHRLEGEVRRRAHTAGEWMTRERWRRSLVHSAMLLLLVVAGVACGSPAPAAPGEGSAASQSASKPPAGTVAASEWEQTVSAAKREGRVVVIGTNTAESREALTQGFEQRYPEIQVEYLGQGSSDIVPRVIGERQAGKYLTDVLIHGPPTHFQLIRVDAMDPLAPYLVGPESREASKWEGGRFEFADYAEKYILVLTYVAAPAMLYNPSLVSRGEITSYKDLLSPKWKGRIAMVDPRVPGAGQAMVTRVLRPVGDPVAAAVS